MTVKARKSKPARAKLLSAPSPGGNLFSRWMKLSSDMMMAQFEAQQVIGLRLMKLARGGAAAETESRRMVTEKMSAAARTGIALSSGKSAESVVRHYRTIMRANKQRLGRF